MNDRMKIFYMNVAEQCARMSRAVRLKVGAVVVKDNNIVFFLGMVLRPVGIIAVKITST